MSVKCSCQHCLQNLEFDAEHAGASINCPHCGKLTTLYIPAKSTLINCQDCGQPVSRAAASCPACGRPVKPAKSIFHFVFWGVVSLAATFVLLGGAVIFLGGGLAVIGAANRKTTKDVATDAAKPSAPRYTSLTREEEIQAATFLATLTAKHDDVTDYTWLTAPHGDGVDVYLYLGKKNDHPFLRLKFRQESSHWTFFRKILIRADDELLTIVPEGDVRRDSYSGSYCEVADEPAAEHISIVEKIIHSTNCVIRFAGTEHQEDFTVSDSQKSEMAQFLLAYRYLGGNYTSN